MSGCSTGTCNTKNTYDYKPERDPRTYFLRVAFTQSSGSPPVVPPFHHFNFYPQFIPNSSRTKTVPFEYQDITVRKMKSWLTANGMSPGYVNLYTLPTRDFPDLYATLQKKSVVLSGTKTVKIM